MNTCQLADLPTIKEVLQAVKKYAYDRHSTLTYSDVERWNPTDEEWDAYEFENGYLVINVANVFLDEIVGEDMERTYYVSASIYTGDDLLGDPDLYET